LEDDLGALRRGVPLHMLYETTFFVEWPEHLGGGRVAIDFAGAMLLLPVLAV
jgi:hypothetical protein